LINKPTRVTIDSTTLIDNILTNVHHTETVPGTWVVDLSDHLLVFSVLPSNTKKAEEELLFTIVSFSLSLVVSNAASDRCAGSASMAIWPFHSSD